MTRPSIRRTLPAAIAATALGLTALSAVGAQAAETESSTASMTCVLKVEGKIDPPIDLVTKKPANFNGKDGTAACEGTIGGETVDTTELGSWGVNADTDEPINCASLASGFTGTGTSSIAVTTVDGQKKTHTTTFSFQIAGGLVVVSGGLEGTATFQPTEGDCQNTPVKRALVEFAVKTKT
ncbi:hypothetical protein [Nocardiopsis rhodophaea]|uniref:hypothetical protein n=1 Tax=Nocardiopsis rhodophaea TaxID=280238 RepID=UPI0031DD48B9